MRRPTVNRAMTKSATATAMAICQGSRKAATATMTPTSRIRKIGDHRQLHAEADADQRIGGERADEQGEDRAAERDDDRVDVGAERVVLEQHEAPRRGLRLEVDERQVERAVGDVALVLERGDQHPVEGHQDDQRPDEQEA
jgi:hypothetical protein